MVKISSGIIDVPPLEAQMVPIAYNLAGAMRHPPIAKTFMQATNWTNKAIRHYDRAILKGKEARGGTEEDADAIGDFTRGLIIRAHKKFKKIQQRSVFNN